MEDREYIKDAINNVIGADAVNSALDSMINRSEEVATTPKQVKETVETIVEIKKDVNNIENKNYQSDLLKENSEKLKRAIEEGISPNEVTRTLVDSTNKGNSIEGKRHLNFVAKLISKMKKIELNLKQRKENNIEKGRQKILDK